MRLKTLKTNGDGINLQGYEKNAVTETRNIEESKRNTDVSEPQVDLNRQKRDLKNGESDDQLDQLRKRLGFILNRDRKVELLEGRTEEKRRWWRKGKKLKSAKLKGRQNFTKSWGNNSKEGRKKVGRKGSNRWNGCNRWNGGIDGMGGKEKSIKENSG